MTTRRVVLLHRGEWRTWRDLDRRMGNVDVRFVDHHLLLGRDGIPDWVHHPYRASNGARHIGRWLRRRTVRGALSRHLRQQDPRPVVLVTDLERLTPEQAEAVATWLPWFERHATVLNHPLRTRRRLDLLQHFAATGRSNFRAWRSTDPAADPRFPVFVRRERDHEGPLTEPLTDADALRGALDDLVRRGLHPEALLVVEKLDVPTVEGKTPKFSAVRVGDAVFPRHLFFSDSWVAKSAAEQTSRTHLDLEWSFIEDFPYEADVRDRFEAAGVDYGRIDFAIVDGRVETFEINTNPSWIKPGYFDPSNPRVRVHERFRDRLRDAFDRLP